MTQVASVEGKSPKGNGKGKTSGEASKGKTIAIQVPETLHAAVTEKANELDYSVNSVGKALFGMWVEGATTIPVPVEKVRNDLTAELANLITSDPSRADAVRKFLAELGKKTQGK